jgi:hypothetical protein
VIIRGAQVPGDDVDGTSAVQRDSLLEQAAGLFVSELSVARFPRSARSGRECMSGNLEPNGYGLADA